MIDYAKPSVAFLPLALTECQASVKDPGEKARLFNGEYDGL
jgi:hypothetical protein